MQILKDLLRDIISFRAEDINIMSTKDGKSTLLGGVVGAFYEGQELIVEDVAKNHALSNDIFWDIVLTALIGSVVAFLVRKIMTAVWDNLIQYFKKRKKK